MRTQLAGLDVQLFQAAPGAPAGAVILCHGFGAPGDDLVGLGAELVRRAPSLAAVRFYFPAAPLSLGASGWGESRAWWLIDMVQLQRLQAADPAELTAFRRLEPEGMAQARRALLKLVSEVLEGTKLSPRQLVLGGFSQGAMLATDVALRLEEAPAGLCVLSGTLLIEDAWKPKIAARTAMPVFQSHGRSDPVLPFDAARALEALFVEAGTPHEFVAFDGGHGIDESTLAALATFLERRFS